MSRNYHDYPVNIVLDVVLRSDEMIKKGTVALLWSVGTGFLVKGCHSRGTHTTHELCGWSDKATLLTSLQMAANESVYGQEKMETH